MVLSISTPATQKEKGSYIADISQLGNLQPTEPLELPEYKAATDKAPMPHRGVYKVRAPETFSFAPTQAGFLSAQVDPTIVGPTNEGYTLRFTKVSAKTWPDKFNNGKPTSQLGRYLKATGLNEVIAGSPQAQADAVEKTANVIYPVLVDWRAYCKGCGYQVEGEDKFPSDGNGGHTPFVQCPNCLDPETEKPLVIRGNAFVARFLSNE